MADPRVWSDRNGFCIIGGHGRMTVWLLDGDGVGFPCTASSRLAPALWRREPKVGMNPTLRIDRRDS